MVFYFKLYTKDRGF